MKQLELLEGILEFLFLLLIILVGGHCGNSKEVNKYVTKKDESTGHDLKIGWVDISTRS